MIQFILTFFITLTILGITFLLFALHKQSQQKIKIAEKNVQEQNNQIQKQEEEQKQQENQQKLPSEQTQKKVLHILYATHTGTAETLAKQLNESIQEQYKKIKQTELETKILNLENVVVDELQEFQEIAFVISTWENGGYPESTQKFFKLLLDYTQDYRISKQFLSQLKYTIFCIGNTEYDTNFCKLGKTLDKQLQVLGAQNHMAVFLCDTNKALKPQIQKYEQKIIQLLFTDQILKETEKQLIKKKEHVQIAAQEEDVVNDQFLEAADDNTNIDIEDLDKVISGPKEMVTARQRQNLEKSGYKIVGSHSAVKLCRWTKNMLRGRGHCYKHAFYGIISYSCMEATTSLACANKCEFCWRHHKNPVGTSFRWVVDDPNQIIEDAIQKHKLMIKEIKDISDVIPERYQDAQIVRHCALSLVGESIMYPRMNEALTALHGRKISSFMVTNGQMPENIKKLDPVTQLYISIDAPNRDTLKSVDRPLFKDFWERFIECLRDLKNKPGRTVYRLTLISGWNMQDIDGYAKLALIGNPDFIEIKAVTYSGTSDANKLSMKNVPYHSEVRDFAEKLTKIINTLYSNSSSQSVQADNNNYYDLASEHEHSCCVLIAKTSKYKVNGVWNTWIDYEKFFQLYSEFLKNGKHFSGTEYSRETPSWALYNAPEKGMAPENKKYIRKGKIVQTE